MRPRLASDLKRLSPFQAAHRQDEQRDAGDGRGLRTTRSLSRAGIWGGAGGQRGWAGPHQKEPPSYKEPYKRLGSGGAVTLGMFHTNRTFSDIYSWIKMVPRQLFLGFFLKSCYISYLQPCLGSSRTFLCLYSVNSHVVCAIYCLSSRSGS